MGEAGKGIRAPCVRAGHGVQESNERPRSCRDAKVQLRRHGRATVRHVVEPGCCVDCLARCSRYTITRPWTCYAVRARFLLLSRAPILGGDRGDSRSPPSSRERDWVHHFGPSHPPRSGGYTVDARFPEPARAPGECGSDSRLSPCRPDHANSRGTLNQSPGSAGGLATEPLGPRSQDQRCSLVALPRQSWAVP
jgi:hypothetical protein